MQVWSLGQEDPLEEGMATSVILPGEPHEQRSLVGYSPKGRKEWDTPEWLSAAQRSTREQEGWQEENKELW